jgi:hypothetical protein
VSVLHLRIDLQLALLKDLRRDRVRAIIIVRMTNSAGTCRARSCSDSVDWLSYERICNPVAISRRWSEACIDGCWRITKIQGMSASSFLEGKPL